MSHKTVLFLFVVSFLLSACSPGQFLGPTLTPAPTITPTSTVTPFPTATLTPPPTLTPTLTPTPIVYDGHWNGTTSAGGRISFEVKENKIPSIKVNFGLSAKNSSCNVNITVTTNPGQAITLDQFSLEIPSLTIKGIFDSATNASGTVEAAHDSPHCSGGVNLTWTAKKQ